MGLVAQVLAALTWGAAWRPTARTWVRPARGLGFAWIVGHLMVSPLALALTSAFAPRAADRTVTEAVARLAIGPEMQSQILVVVNTPDLLRGIYGFVIPRDASSHPPRGTRILSATYSTVAVTRTDAHTIAVRPKEGFLHDVTSALLSSDAEPMHLGQTVRLPGMTVEVTEMNAAGRPAEASFRFTVPLEDASLRWVAWDGAHFQDFTPPPVGAQVVVGVEGFVL